MSKLISLDIDRKFCPCCNSFIAVNTATDGSGSAPSAGDISVCSVCYEILEFNDQNSLRRLSNEKFMKLPEQTRIDLNNLIFIMRNAH